ncbi:hypothetical protein O3G_MSEX012154 [Manduca sexta]|uniref:Uncharacterized protein n=1 Tax=Manduca sexta TaxID=7130 RepID=A0A922CWL6_MANSE|nr:hypothetical protein O3G_MSEX012154 [Manduca sexta]
MSRWWNVCVATVRRCCGAAAARRRWRREARAHARRVRLVKKQLEETKTLTIKLENKEADIKELRKALKAKQEELSEMQIRRELGERKLSAAARDHELRAEQLQRKLDDAHNQLRRKEKEFEETMDHLQQDIDSLESERGALRDKLKLYAKRGGVHHGTYCARATTPLIVVYLYRGVKPDIVIHVSVSRSGISLYLSGFNKAGIIVSTGEG